MRYTKTVLPAILSVILLLGTTQAAFAGMEMPIPPEFCANDYELIPASGGSGPGTFTPVFPCEPASYVIGFPDEEIVVSADPNSGPWYKVLIIEEEFWDCNGDCSDELYEFIEVGPGPAWTDWHEEILIATEGEGIITNPDHLDFIESEYGSFFFEEAFGFVFNPDDSPYMGDVIVDESPTGIWVDFIPPLEPGSKLFIFKEITFTGDEEDLHYFTEDGYFLILSQYPTFGKKVIGGEELSINSAALFVGGFSSIAIWLVPITAGITGTGYYLVKTKLIK